MYVPWTLNCKEVNASSTPKYHFLVDWFLRILFIVISYDFRNEFKLYFLYSSSNVENLQMILYFYKWKGAVVVPDPMVVGFTTTYATSGYHH